MAKIAVGIPIYSMLYPLVDAPAHPQFVTTEKYFKEAGVIGMSHSFKEHYVGLKVGAKEPSVLALLRLNWEISDPVSLRRLANKAEVSVTEFLTALSTGQSKKRIIGHVRGIGGNHNHYDVVVATYMEGFLAGWNADVRSIMDKSHWPVGSTFVTQWNSEGGSHGRFE